MTRSLLGSWIAALPLTSVLAFEAGFLTERSYPMAAGIAVLLVVLSVPLAWLALDRGAPAGGWDRSARLITGCLCALLAWVVITQAASPRLSGYARVGDTAMLVSLALSVLLLRPEPRAMLGAVGAAIAAMTLVSVVVSGCHGKLATTENLAFGLGAQPILGCLATPVLSAWAISLWLRRTEEVDRPRLAEVALCGAALLALGVFVVLAQRRGPVVGIAAIAAVLLGRRLWRDHPRLTVGAAALVTAALAAYLVHHLRTDLGIGRSERYSLYRTAWDIGWHGFPFGNGPYGMLAADAVATPSAQMWVALENCAFHAHNEVLNAWVEGGVIQLVLVVALGWLHARRILACPDPVLKTAFIALGAAWMVHAMTDNTFGIPLGMAWVGVVSGMVLILPQPPAAGLLPWPAMMRWLTIATGSLAIITGWPTARMALLSDTTPKHARLTALETCRDPGFVLNEVGILVNAPDADDPVKVIAVEMGENRLGWTSFTPRAAVTATGANGDYPRCAGALVRVAERSPLDLDVLVTLLRLIGLHPEVAVLVPAPIQLRCAVLTGLLSVTVDEAAIGRDWQVASLCLARIRRACDLRTLTSEHRRQMLILMEHYGQLTPVASCALRVCSQGTADDVREMMRYSDRLAGPLSSSQELRTSFRTIVTAEHAGIVMPLVAAVHATRIGRLERREPPVFAYARNRDDRAFLEERAVWQEVVRLWSLWRLLPQPALESVTKH